MLKLGCVKLFKNLLLIILLSTLAGFGCSKTIRALPQVERKQAVLKIPLSQKPLLPLTDDDVRALLKFDPRITAIIFDNQADWFAIYDEAGSTIRTHENYEANLLGGGDQKK